MGRSKGRIGSASFPLPGIPVRFIFLLPSPRTTSLWSKQHQSANLLYGWKLSLSSGLHLSPSFLGYRFSVYHCFIRRRHFHIRHLGWSHILAHLMSVSSFKWNSVKLLLLVAVPNGKLWSYRHLTANIIQSGSKILAPATDIQRFTWLYMSTCSAQVFKTSIINNRALFQPVTLDKLRIK